MGKPFHVSHAILCACDAAVHQRLQLGAAARERGLEGVFCLLCSTWICTYAMHMALVVLLLCCSGV